MDLARPGLSLRSHLPTRVRGWIKRVARRFAAWRLTGDEVTCPICGSSFRAFLPRNRKPNVQCPRCWSLVRHRALWLFLRDRMRVGERPVRLLHFAPEQGIERRLRALPMVEYTSGDIDNAIADDRVDIARLPYADESFDIVLCSHVLEHVPDDRAAIHELARIVKPGGTVVVVVPIRGEKTEEFKDPSPIPAYADGYLRIGPHGHVRDVGADYPHRLEAAGFSVQVVDHAASLSEAERSRYRVTPGQPFFLCTPRDDAASREAVAAWRAFRN